MWIIHPTYNQRSYVRVTNASFQLLNLRSLLPLCASLVPGLILYLLITMLFIIAGLLCQEMDSEAGLQLGRLAVEFLDAAHAQIILRQAQQNARHLTHYSDEGGAGEPRGGYFFRHGKPAKELLANG